MSQLSYPMKNLFFFKKKLIYLSQSFRDGSHFAGWNLKGWSLNCPPERPQESRFQSQNGVPFPRWPDALNLCVDPDEASSWTRANFQLKLKPEEIGQFVSRRGNPPPPSFLATACRSTQPETRTHHTHTHTHAAIHNPYTDAPTSYLSA